MAAAERKKSLSKTHDQSPERGTKRARLTRSASRALDEPATTAASSDPSSNFAPHSQNGRQSKTGTSVVSPSNENAQNLDGDESTPTPMPSSRLPELLDLSAVVAHTDIVFRFGQIARSLMHEHVLVVSPSSSQSKNTRPEYELLEVEFYLRKEGHEDPFTHGSAEQVESGRW